MSNFFDTVRQLNEMHRYTGDAEKAQAHSETAAIHSKIALSGGGDSAHGFAADAHGLASIFHKKLADYARGYQNDPHSKTAAAVHDEIAAHHEKLSQIHRSAAAGGQE